MAIETPSTRGNLESFLEYLRAQNLSPRTVQTYEESVNQFANYLGGG